MKTLVDFVRYLDAFIREDLGYDDWLWVVTNFGPFKRRNLVYYRFIVLTEKGFKIYLVYSNRLVVEEIRHWRFFDRFKT